MLFIRIDFWFFDFCICSCVSIFFHKNKKKTKIKNTNFNLNKLNSHDSESSRVNVLNGADNAKHLYSTHLSSCHCQLDKTT